MLSKCCAVLFPAISWGGGDFPPESQIPPEKHPKYKKTLKNASNLPPDMCSPQNLESRINTGVVVVEGFNRGIQIRYNVEGPSNL